MGLRKAARFSVLPTLQEIPRHARPQGLKPGESALKRAMRGPAARQFPRLKPGAMKSPLKRADKTGPGSNPSANRRVFSLLLPGIAAGGSAPP